MMLQSCLLISTQSSIRYDICLIKFHAAYIKR
nr:MAG TPA: hypothetical protein [Crassvirales sp.]